MINVSNTLEHEQIEPVVSPHNYKLFVYKQFDGEIISYGLSTVRIRGDGSNFFAIDDIIILSCSNLNTEYTIASLTYDSTNGYTDITINESVTFEQNLPHKDRVYKKYDVTEYVTAIGDVRKFIEDRSFGKLRPFQLNFSLIDDQIEYTISGRKDIPGIFFKGFYQAQVVSSFATGNFTAINLTEPITGVYDSQLFKQYHLKVLDGNAKDKKLKICSVSSLYKRLYVYGDVSDTLSQGDTIYVPLQTKYFTKLIFGINHYESDDVNIIFGVIQPRNITKANKRIDLIAYSLVKDWDTEYSYQVTREANRLSNIPGVTVYSYDLASKANEQEGVINVEYKFKSGNLQSVTGIKIVEVSSDTGIDLRLLRFRKPNKFQWSSGSWTILSSEATSQTLTASDGSYIKVDCRPSDYASTDAEELIYMDNTTRMEVAVNSRGPAGIRVDSGNWVQLFTKFFRIWRDDSYVAGTISDEADMYDVSVNDSPIKIIPTTAGAWTLSFGSTQKFSAFEIVGLKELGTTLSGITWEYSLSYGDDPDCFSTLTVTDGTNGFSHDGIINLDIPDDWGMKAKVGDSTDFHMYWVRMGASSGTERNVEQIIPYTTAFGSSNDAFTFKSRWEELSKKDDIKDELIIRYDTNGNLILATWKQCVRAIDVYDELINKSGYGINKSTIADAGLISLPKANLNVWGKPFNADFRKPTSICLGEGQCAGYIFATFENAIFRLKSEVDEWELLYECDPNYTLNSVAYWDAITEDAALRYFILANGYLNITPPGTFDETKFYEQPKQIMVRIDDVDGDGYFTTIGYQDNGGVINSSTGFTDGNGLIDTRFLIRGGCGKTVTGLPNVRTHLIGTFTADSMYGENIIIPFNQLVMRLNNFTPYVTAGDVEVDVVSIIDSRTSSIEHDLNTPAWLDPGFYLIQASLEASIYALQGAMDFRFTMGQDGGNCKTYWPNLAVFPFYGIFGQGRYDTVNWVDQRRIYTTAYMKYGKGSFAGVLNTDLGIGYGCGHWAESAYVGTKFKARTELLCAAQFPEDVSGDETDYVVAGTYVDFYQLTNTDKYTEKRLELITRRSSIDAAMWPIDMYLEHYDSGGTIQHNKTYASTPPFAMDVAQNEYLVIADDRKFERLYFQSSIAGTVTLTVEYYNGVAWVSENVHVDDFSGFTGVTNGEISFPMDRRNVISDMFPNITQKFMVKITNTGTGTWTVNDFGVLRREVWNSRDNDYWGAGITKYYDFVPLELTYNEYDNYVYGCMLDQLTLEYHLFAYGDKTNMLTDANEYTTALPHTQITDPDMQPVSFASDNTTGWVYFVATDRKNKRKTAELWRTKYDSVGDTWTKEKLTEIVVGEWDCRTKLVIYNSKVYGFTAPNYGYFWQWSTDFYLRIPVFNTGKQKIRETLSSVGQLLNLISYTDEYAKTIIDFRFKDSITYDTEWGIENIQNVEFIRESTAHVDGVIIEWKHDEIEGTEYAGDIDLNANVLSISNPYVMFPQISKMLADFLWKYLVKNRREIEGSLIFQYQHQINDAIIFRGDTIPWLADRNIGNDSIWQIKMISVSWKNKKIKFFLEESTNKYDSAS